MKHAMLLLLAAGTAGLLCAAPHPAPDDSWRFAVFGDTHVTPSQTSIPSEIVAALLEDGVSLVLVAGDLAEAGRGASLTQFRNQLLAWREVFAPLYAAGIGVYPVRGNHEADVANGLDTWKSIFSGSYAPPANGPAGEEGLTYSLVCNNARFIALDQYVAIHTVNQAWLDTQLAADPDHPHVFVFGHEPAFKVFHSDCLDADPPRRNTFWESLAAAGARLYFSGHDHFFDAARIDDGDGRTDDDLYQIVAGTGGGDKFLQYNYNGSNDPYDPAGMFHEAQFGYILVEVSGSDTSGRAVTLTWKHRVADDAGGVSYAATDDVIRYSLPAAPAGFGYPVVDTGVTACFDDTAEIVPPASGQDFFGQDAQHAGHTPAYTDNGDGTVTDTVTGLMWIQARGAKVSWSEALAGAASCSTGDYSDWRVPTIKELYSLILFTGAQGASLTSPAGYIPFIDTACFDFAYGTGTGDERVIDCQDWSATEYVSTTMGGVETVFGVNFADGRIKGYPKYLQGSAGGSDNLLYVRYVRGNPAYGANRFVDNMDGTILDAATGLMWDQADSGSGMDWRSALAWVQAKNAQNHREHGDWRLPNAKELHSIVDYSRSPDTTASAALNPLFSCTPITNEGGEPDFPFFWTSTSFRDGTPDGVPAAYICFGRGLGWMQRPPGSGEYQLEDVHGAGAQRSDPKSGSASEYPLGRGPQGDVVRIDNFARLVRDAPAGDVNIDATVDAADVALLRNYLAGNARLTPAGRALADLTGEGDVSVLDLLFLTTLLLP